MAARLGQRLGDAPSQQSRGERRRRTARRRRIVDENLELFANADGASAVGGVTDANFGKAVVHRPLLGCRRIIHLHLDLVQQTVQVQPIGTFDHAIRR